MRPRSHEIDRLGIANRQHPARRFAPVTNIWDNFFYHQQKRAPDAFERLGVVAELPGELDRYIAEAEARSPRPFTPEERAVVKSPEGLARIVQAASVQARGRGSQEVKVALAARGLAFARITSHNKSFTTDAHTRRKDYLREPELDQFLKAARGGKFGIRDHALAFVAARHGLRVSELIDIRITDLNLEDHRNASIALHRLTSPRHPQEPALPIPLPCAILRPTTRTVGPPQ